MNSRIGIVVPTLGRRPEYLQQCLRSIRAAGKSYVLLISPPEFDTTELYKAGLIDGQANDPGTGLSGAINFGIRSLPSNVELVNWLGDDDLLSHNSLEITSNALLTDPKTVMVFGACAYIDSMGETIWTNWAGQWAVPLLRFGPDLIPQPGALFRRSYFDEVGGLSENLDWAFDFDLFINFSKLGRMKYLKTTLANFRWHPESLSVEHRSMSVSEASKVRVSHLPSFLKPFSNLWEYPVRQVTMFAGNRLTLRATEQAQRK